MEPHERRFQLVLMVCGMLLVVAVLGLAVAQYNLSEALAAARENTVNNNIINCVQTAQLDRIARTQALPRLEHERRCPHIDVEGYLRK